MPQVQKSSQLIHHAVNLLRGGDWLGSFLHHLLKISQILQTLKKENRSAIYNFQQLKHVGSVQSNTISKYTNLCAWRHFSPAPPSSRPVHTEWAKHWSHNAESATTYRNLSNCDVLPSKHNAVAKIKELFQIERERDDHLSSPESIGILLSSQSHQPNLSSVMLKPSRPTSHSKELRSPQQALWDTLGPEDCPPPPQQVARCLISRIQLH